MTILPLSRLHGQSDYDRHILFDHSLTPDRYFHSVGTRTGPNQVRLDRGRLPVDTVTFFTPPNALRLEWRSAPGGHWTASVRVDRFRNRPPLVGDTLSFWWRSASALPASQLPGLRLQDSTGTPSFAVDLADLSPDLPTGRWVQVRVPLSVFRTPAGTGFDAARFTTLTFVQGRPDTTARTLAIDEIRVDGDTATAGVTGPIAAPAGLRARGSARHVDLTWTPVPDSRVERYVIYRSVGGGDFRPVGIQRAGVHRYADFLGAPGRKASYRITASGRDYRESSPSQPAAAATRPLSDDELLTMVQEAHFRYYWEGAHPVPAWRSRTVRATTTSSPRARPASASWRPGRASSAGSSRASRAAKRMLNIVGFLARADRFHGVWPHFLDGTTGEAMPLFGMYDNGGDLVETSFLIQGLLAARQYFDRDTPPSGSSRADHGALGDGGMGLVPARRPTATSSTGTGRPTSGFTSTTR